MTLASCFLRSLLPSLTGFTFILPELVIFHIFHTEARYPLLKDFFLRIDFFIVLFN